MRAVACPAGGQLRCAPLGHFRGTLGWRGLSGVFVPVWDTGRLGGPANAEPWCQDA